VTNPRVHTTSSISFSLTIPPTSSVHMITILYDNHPFLYLYSTNMSLLLSSTMQPFLHTHDNHPFLSTA
jgi:hypothetical protein